MARTLLDDISLSPSHHEKLNDTMHDGQEQSFESSCYRPINMETLTLMWCTRHLLALLGSHSLFPWLHVLKYEIKDGDKDSSNKMATTSHPLRWWRHHE